jgi:hypothetical protein
MDILHRLAVYLLGTMNTFTPQSEHEYYEDPAITEMRYQFIADELAAVSLDPRRQPLFRGEDGRIKTGLLLVVMMSRESSFKNDVISCEKLGDQGSAFGPYQTHLFEDTVCQNVFQASWVAIDQIRESFSICRDMPPSSRLAFYTDGNSFHSKRAEKRSSDRINSALNYYWNHPLHLPSN